MRSAALKGILATVFLSAASGTTLAGGVPAVEIGHPWALATPPSAETGAAYVTLTNAGPQDDRLIGATSDRAERVDLHCIEIADGVTTMRPAPDGLVLPAGGTVELQPGGFHLMLLGLDAPLAAGDTVAISLTFEQAGEVTASFAIRPPAAAASVSGGLGHDDHDH